MRKKDDEAEEDGRGEVPPEQVRDTGAEDDVRAIIRDVAEEAEVEEFLQRMYTRDSDSLLHTSDLKRREIAHYNAGFWFARRYGQEWLAELLETDLALRVSIDRRGREEYVSAMTGAVEQRMRVRDKVREYLKTEG